MKRFFLIVVLLCTIVAAFAANTTTSVIQVTEAVTLSEDVDYHITSTEPFTTTGSINIVNTEHAVVILDNVKPSEAKSFLPFITINGEEAKNNTNCQIRIYNRGAIIYPYGNAVKMLTAYTEENFGGESYNNYRIGNNGGFMLTLKDSELNNKIKSFKLKRGYMVTFAIGTGGYGYSRCFIADKEDLEMAKLPAILSGRISSYRIFKWQDVSKRGYSGLDANVNRLLNTTWFYGWDAGEGNIYEDYEYVPQHHHEGWPAIADVGKNGNSAHALGNNEPDNKADDKEQDLDPENVLANWPQMMATGKRLGSPAMSGNKSWLKTFMDAVDNNGWRVDFIAVHDYNLNDRDSKIWNVNDYSSIGKGRPVWLTEMNYGANWTGWPGGNREGNAANYKIELDHFGPTIDGYNGSDIVERYAVYNWVEDCRKVYNDGDQSLKSKNYLTPMGEYYASVNPGLAYNAKNEFIPRVPRASTPTDLAIKYVASNGQCTLSWKEATPELLNLMTIEVKNGKGNWEQLSEVAIDEGKYNYEYKFTNDLPGNYAYRIHLVDYNNANHYSDEIYNIISGTELFGCADVQIGTLTISNSTETYSFFAEPFTSKPAIVFGSVSNSNSSAGLTERVRGVTYSSRQYKNFTASILPLAYGSKTDFYRGDDYPEYTSYFAVKQGTGTIGDLAYEATIISSKQVGDTVDYTFAQPFNDIPVVLATPLYATVNYPLLWRVFDVTKEGCRVVLQRQAALDEDPKTPRNPAEISLLAIEKGVSTVDDKVIIVNNDEFTFTSGATLAQTIEYGMELTDPKVLIQLQSFDRKVAGNLRTQSVAPDATQTKVRLQLDYSNKDNNTISRNKPVTERMGWIITGIPDGNVGIQMPTKELRQLAVYPSIVETTFGVRDDQATTLSLFSTNGKLLRSEQLCEGQATLNISNLPAGIYIVRTNANHSAKIIKK